MVDSFLTLSSPSSVSVRKKRLWHRLRLSQLIIFSAFLILSGRLHQVAQQVLETTSFSLDIGSPAHGENSPPPPSSPPSLSSSLPPASQGEKSPSSTPTPPSPSPGEKDPKNPSSSSPLSKGEAPLSPLGAPGQEPKASTGDSFELLEMTPREIQLLQTLSQRRKLLETQEAHFHQKSSELQVTQHQLDSKISKLKDLEENLKKLLNEYNNLDQQKTKNIAKIYENMKPKEAARIFEILDMPLLLNIMENMKEAKISLILANVPPEKAKEITSRFLERRKATQEPDKNEKN